MSIHASDDELLGRFAATRDEAAFRGLVERHVDHVHSVAWRTVRCRELAVEVVQQVFIRLAGTGGHLPRQVPLSAWLHVTAHALAVDAVRAESARRRREQRYHDHAMTPSHDDGAGWSLLEPVIDEAVAALPDRDREVILLRFYRQCRHAEVGRRLGLSEDAARMRVQRALEKLRSLLARRGITTTADALALTLPGYAVAAAPAGLASTVASSALAAAVTAPTASALSLPALLTMTKSHITTVAAIAITLPIIGLQFVQNSRLHDQIEAARREADQRDALPARRPGPASGTLSNDAAGPSAKTEGNAATPVPTGTSLQEILARRDPAGRLQGLVDYVNRLPASQLRQAIAELEQSSPEWDPESKLILHMMLTRWAREEPDAAFASLDTLGTRNRGERASSILASLAAVDPDRAATWLASPDNKLVDFPFMGHILAGTVGKEWMRQDTDSALSWAANLPEAQRAGAYVGILGTLASTDPGRAAALATTLEPGDARRIILGDIGEAWALKAPQEAMAWVQSLDPSDRPAALRDTLNSWATAQPAEAAAFVQTMPAAELTGDLLKSVAEPWAVKAPEAAAAWVMNQAEGKAQNDAIGSVVWNWTKQDPLAASTWLRDQPAGTARDSAIGGLALATFDNDPAGAVTWAAQMADDQSRTQAVTIGLTEWLKRDPAAATSWARENGVSLPEARSPQTGPR